MLSCVCDAKNTGYENQYSSISGGGQFEIDIAYIDPTSGLVMGAEQCRSSVSAARANSQRHRSVVIDPETLSLPSQFGALAESVDILASQDILTLNPSRGGTSVTNGGIPVVSLSLTSVCLSNQLIDKMAACLCRYPSLRILSLVKCHRTALCLEHLRSLVTNRKSVGRFDGRLIRLDVRLSRDVIDGGSNSHLGSDLSRIAGRSLRSLCVNGSGLTSSGSTDLFRNFVAGSRFLTELDIGFNDVTDSRPIADTLSANCSLRRLRLRGNAINSDGARLIFDALRRNYRLENLDVSGNSFGSSITDRSYTKTAPIIPSSTSSVSNLMDVDGQQGPVGSVGKSLAEALVCNRTLREFHAERCGLGVDECRGLARALLTNTTLSLLDISSNPAIGDLGLAILSTSISRNRRCVIETLSMNMCSISDDGLGLLLTSIDGSETRHSSFHRHQADNSRTRLRLIKLCYNNIELADRTNLILQKQQQQQQQQQFRHRGVLDEHTWTGRMRYAVGERPPSPVCGSHEVQSRSSSNDGPLDDNHIDMSLSQRQQRSDDVYDVIISGQSGSDIYRKANGASPNTPVIDTQSVTELGNNFRLSYPHAKVTLVDRPIKTTLINSVPMYTREVLNLNQSWDASVPSSLIANYDNNNNNNNNNNTTVCRADHFGSSHTDTNTRIADDRFSLKSPTTFVRGHHVYHSHQQLVNLDSDCLQLFRSASSTVTTGGNGVIGHKPRSSTPVDPSISEKSEVEEDSGRDVYQLMCQVLATNPKLKILLWGNSRSTTNNHGKSSRQLFGDVREDDDEQSTDDKNKLVTSPLDDWNAAAICRKYATLPLRSHESRDFDKKGTVF